MMNHTIHNTEFRSKRNFYDRKIPEDLLKTGNVKFYYCRGIFYISTKAYINIDFFPTLGSAVWVLLSFFEPIKITPFQEWAYGRRICE